MEYDSSRAAYKKALNMRTDISTNVKLGLYSILDGDYEKARRYFDAFHFDIPLIEVHRGRIVEAEKKLAAMDRSYFNKDQQIPDEDKFLIRIKTVS